MENTLLLHERRMAGYQKIGNIQQNSDISLKQKNKEIEEVFSRIYNISTKNFSLPKQEEQSDTVQECHESFVSLEDKDFLVEDTTDRIPAIDKHGEAYLLHPAGDVRQYGEGATAVQFFDTREAVLREVKKAGKRLPASAKSYENLIAKKYNKNYQDFLKDEKITYPGSYDRTYDLRHEYELFHFWCEDGSRFYGSKFNHNKSVENKNGGYTARCIK